jgi:hypothetical protein
VWTASPRQLLEAADPGALRCLCGLLDHDPWQGAGSAGYRGLLWTASPRCPEPAPGLSGPIWRRRAPRPRPGGCRSRP